jgi:hypothetical protein
MRPQRRIFVGRSKAFIASSTSTASNYSEQPGRGFMERLSIVFALVMIKKRVHYRSIRKTSNKP